MVGIGMWACLARVPAPPGTRKVSLAMLASRGVLAGGCIVTSIWLSGKGLPLISGIASVFPAIFLTTMIALWLSQGEAVQAGAVGPLMLGSTSVAVYALLATVTLPMGFGLGFHMGMAGVGCARQCARPCLAPSIPRCRRTGP